MWQRVREVAEHIGVDPDEAVTFACANMNRFGLTWQDGRDHGDEPYVSTHHADELKDALWVELCVRLE